MEKKDMLEKIEEIRENLDELEEMTGKDKPKHVEQSVFLLSMSQVAGMLRNGFESIFKVGDLIVNSHAEAGQIAWVVIGKDMDHDPEHRDGHTLTLHMRDVLPGCYSFDDSKKGAPYGRNQWAVSDLRRKLNGDFLGGFTTEDQEAMLRVQKKTFNTTTDEFDETMDKLFLLSCTEVGFKPNTYIKEEGAAYPYFTDNENRQKTDCDGDTRYWWLRSPNPSITYIVRSVRADGTLNSHNAYYGVSAAAACVIG